VAVATTGYSLLLLIRPVLARHRASAADRLRARSIVRSYGQTSLAPLALLDDKLYCFSPGGSVVAYVVEGRTALALGDPIGPDRDLPQAIESFRNLCSLNDWFPAFYQVLPDHLRLYHRLGFRSLQIGQEAMIELQSFSLEGGDRKNIRTSVNKMKRLGCAVEVVDPPHTAALLRELNEISDGWLSERQASEMRFSVGWFDEAYLNACPILLVRSAHGQIDAFANINVEFRANEVTADLMRHRPGAEKGQMDFLFASLLSWAKSKGYARFNFGLSALAGIGEQPGDPAIERALRYAFEHMHQFYNFKGLHAYKAKYGPVWSPRFLVYPDLPRLAAVGAALIQANTGNDFLGGYLLQPH
jgi:phosphatidylglycerol lysyltransferase